MCLSTPNHPNIPRPARGHGAGTVATGHQASLNLKTSEAKEEVGPHVVSERPDPVVTDLVDPMNPMSVTTLEFRDVTTPKLYALERT